MTLFQPKERRKNRSGLAQDRSAIQYARAHKTLVEISNKTRSQMSDAEFRDWAQDEAHFAIENARRIP